MKGVQTPLNRHYLDLVSVVFVCSPYTHSILFFSDGLEIHIFHAFLVCAGGCNLFLE
jgi:hypothetical protein